MNHSFSLHRPMLQTSGVILASPHSGRDYPAAFLAQSCLDAHVIRSSEDAFVDLLLADAPRLGAPLLLAHLPRAYIDLNRATDELDPALVQGAARGGHNPRVASGLGVIPRVVAGGRTIYSGKLTLAEAQARIAQGWHPYHQALRELMDTAHATFGQAILLDFHSMPREAIEAHRSIGAPKADIVLGDRHGAAAAGQISDLLDEAFQDVGLKVARNAPFAGAYIAQTYGRPFVGRHAVQIEIDRSLYMDEARITPLPQFAQVRQMISSVLARVIAAQPRAVPLAAE